MPCGFEFNHTRLWLSLKKIFKLSLSAMDEFKFNSIRFLRKSSLFKKPQDDTGGRLIILPLKDDGIGSAKLLSYIRPVETLSFGLQIV
jgi:hypothetical protein